MINLKDKRIWLGLGILASLVVLVLLFRTDRKRFDWRETYYYDSEEPYGTHVIYQLLDTLFAGEQVILLSDTLDLPAAGAAPSNYVFIGAGLAMDTTFADHLLDYVAAGNRAFLSTRVIPATLVDRLYPYFVCEEEYFYWSDYQLWRDSLVELQLLEPSEAADERFTFQYYYKGRSPLYDWTFIDEASICEQDAGVTKLGLMEDELINFVRIRHGKGFVFLHSSPLAFTNVQLLEEPSLRYAEGVFSHLAPGPIYWDEYSKLSEEVARRRNNPAAQPPERRLDARSPLQYVLDEPALTWAWYLLLSLALLYLIFRAKRRQRPIPVLEKNSNTSLEFLSTIGRLYFLQNDHQRLAMQQMRQFRSFVNAQYGLPARDLDGEFVEKLAGKSEISEKAIRSIINQFREIERDGQISADTLIAFHQKIDSFYKHCK